MDLAVASGISGSGRLRSGSEEPKLYPREPPLGEIFLKVCIGLGNIEPFESQRDSPAFQFVLLSMRGFQTPFQRSMDQVLRLAQHSQARYGNLGYDNRRQQ